LVSIKKSEILDSMIESNGKLLQHSVEKINERSKTVRVMNVGENKNILDFLNKKGLEVGAGYGPNKNTQIRVGIFPAVPVEAYERLSQEVLNFGSLG
jgi:phosphoserine aminotransferase